MAINFNQKPEETTDDELHSWVNTKNSHYIALASNELTRRSLGKLQEIIKTFSDQSSKQTDKIIRLTRWIVVLTVMMFVGLVVQVILVL